MKPTNILFLLLAYLGCSALASELLDLTPDNFDNTVTGGKPVLVEFFAVRPAHLYFYLRI